MSFIELLGVCGDQLDPEADQILARCPTVVTSRRHRSLLQGHAGCHLPITPVEAMIERVREALKRGDVCVLASGDPLFFGIGRTLLARFDPEQIRIRPALSSVQLACARFRVPWDDLAVCSLHGRSPASLPGRLLGHPRVMILTDPLNTPDRVATELLQYLREVGDKQRIGGIRIRVAENLGLPEERLHQGTLEEIAATSFASLNLMLMEQRLTVTPPYRFGLGEEDLAHSRGLITKNEVRAAVLHALRLPEPGILWDVGGGSGSISVEAARLCPGLDVFCVEQRPEEQENIRQNIRSYGTGNVRLLAGRAPGALEALPDPDRIFIGGSGGRLAAIIAAGVPRLPSGGRIVVSAVLARTARLAPQLLARAGVRVSQVRIDVRRWTGDQDSATQFHPITLITGEK